MHHQQSNAVTTWLTLCAVLQVRKELGPVDAYFNKLADGMITWIEAWGKLNPNSEP